MEEENVNIKKIITTIDDEKSYSIDVDETTTFYEFKKILAGAAHLLKNCFRIYHEQKEYTNDDDDQSIKELFPDLDPVPLRIISNQDVYEFEDELISLKFNINVPCNTHIGKYKMLYCFTCGQSICNQCSKQDHRNHITEEKADYLAPAQLLMNNIFSNSSLYKADSRLSKYMDCVTFRSNLKNNIFDNLRKLINELEIKFASCLEFFSTSEDETERNTNENLELLKRYCIEFFIKLKNDINTKGIIIDDQIFLTLYYKLKNIEKYKNEKFEENKKKYEKLNTLLTPFVKQVEKISEEIKRTFEIYLNKDIYEIFKNSIQENIVEKIQKEEINNLMFKDLEVPRKSLNRMSLGNITSYKKSGRITTISPDRDSSQRQERNPFQRATLTEKRQGQISQSLMDYNSSSNIKSEKQNNYTNLTWDKVEKQNLIKQGLPIIHEKNDIFSKNNIYEKNNAITTTTTTNINNVGGNSGIVGRKEVIEETITTNSSNTGGIINNINTGSNMKSILNNNISSKTKGNVNINANISESNMNMDNINNLNNIKKETTVYQTTETSYPGQITTFSTQQEYNIHGRSNIQNPLDIQSQKNITQTETSKTITTTTTTSNNLLGYNKNLNTNNIINTNSNSNMNVMNNMGSNMNKNISSNYSKGYEITQHTTTTNQHHSGTQQASSSSSSSNLFNGNLIQVLNNEISKNEREFLGKNQNQNIINETHTEHIYGTNGEIIKKVTKTQTVEYNNHLGNIQDSPIFLFMYPIFGSNQILGAFKNESTGRAEIDFKQAFSGKDISLNAFPEGGAYCNLGHNLYFTGGLEKQKGIGKLFLRVSVQIDGSSVNLTKMPNMLYTHRNHSMIANENYIFVIGGYKSNKCECFNLKTSKWESMPDLISKERQRAMLVIYDDYLYAFMGYTQSGILDSIERINITKLGTSKWEKVSTSNPTKINVKFYGSGIYKQNGKLYFIGGKIGLGNDESDYKNEIYTFSFNEMMFSSTNISFTGQLNFIENQFLFCNEENIGNFIDSDGGNLATISISSFIE